MRAEIGGQGKALEWQERIGVGLNPSPKLAFPNIYVLALQHLGKCTYHAEFLVLACGAASRKYWVGGGGGEREGLKETQARLRINKEDHFSRISNLYGLNIFVYSGLMISKL